MDDDFGPEDYLKKMSAVIRDSNKASYVMVTVLGKMTKTFKPDSSVDPLGGVTGMVEEVFEKAPAPRKKIIRTEDISSIEEYQDEENNTGSWIEWVSPKAPILVEESIYQLAVEAGIKFGGPKNA